MIHREKHYPLFPKIDEEIFEDELVLRSSVYLHKDKENFVKIYQYPVEGTYITKTLKEKELAKELHLKECLKLSKFLNTDVLDTSFLPLVASVDKHQENFFEIIYNNYT